MLNILQWNCRSIIPKKTELIQLLQHHRIDVAAISESWLSPHSPFHIPGYSCLRDDRPDGKGGALLLVNNSLSLSPLPLLPPTDNSQIAGGQIGDFIFISTYIPPRSAISEAQWAHSLGRLTGKVFLLGDFNAHSPVWGCAYSDRQGDVLLNCADRMSLGILNDGSPTLVSLPSERPSAPDISLCSAALLLDSTWCVLEDSLGSDHLPILIEVCGAQLARSTAKRRPLFKPDRSPDNQAEFTAALATAASDLPSITPTSLEECYSSLVSCLTSAADKSFSRQAENPPVRSSPPWWDDDCTQTVSKRKAALSSYLKEMSTKNWDIYHKAAKDCRKLLKFKKKKWLETVLRESLPRYTQLHCLDHDKKVPSRIESIYFHCTKEVCS